MKNNYFLYSFKLYIVITNGSNFKFNYIFIIYKRFIMRINFEILKM